MPTVNNAVAHVFLDSLDTIWNGGTMQCRTGASPGATNAATGTLLCSVAIAADCFAAAANKIKAGNTPWTGDAVATGTIGHVRFVSAGGTHVMECTVSVTGGAGEVQFDTLVVAAVNQRVEVTGFSIYATV